VKTPRLGIVLNVSGSEVAVHWQVKSSTATQQINRIVFKSHFYISDKSREVLPSSLLLT